MQRGEVWVAKLNPNRGREIGKIRPVLIIQTNGLTAIDGAPIVALPLTSQAYPSFRHWRVPIRARDRLLKDCSIAVDQPRVLDRSRFGEGPLTTLTTEEMAAVEKSLKAVLGML
ncbi:MAG TPA: type II toxin-antitoxin system PemK/MazF family toxin [Acidiferrobacter sp.]|nr:type II toxin-antitoxin system PemK/MazF family toxin [Acidiferrobacter sp.]